MIALTRAVWQATSTSDGPSASSSSSTPVDCPISSPTLKAPAGSTVTIESALAWATKPAGADRPWSAARLAVAPGFACYLKAIDPETEIPFADLLPHRAHRPQPHIYSDAE
jgi:hypothetical protein